MLEATDALHACGLVGAAGLEEAHPFAAAPSSWARATGRL